MKYQKGETSSKKKIEKRYLSLLFACILLLSGCGGTTEKSADSEVGEDPAVVERYLLQGESVLTGGLAAKGSLYSLSEVTSEEIEEMDKAMRAYEEPKENLLFVNNAKNFYFYSCLSNEEQDIYDAIMLVLEDPVNEDNIVRYISKSDPGTEEFADAVALAYLSIWYDHPEFFWLYNEIETSICVKYSGDAVYFQLSEPYTNYEKEMTAFNHAVDDFLAEIDTSKSEYEIAEQIHDKLTDLVSYDYQAADADNGQDFAHTAYGALVEDSSGNKNYAVCDGYSLAYEYLLQQVGIDATIVVGKGGYTASDAEGHAWNLVLLDGQWHEVDSTWDDIGAIEDQVENNLYMDDIEYFQEALADEEYRYRIGHYLYNVTTPEMEYFEPGEEYNYYTKDGLKVLCLVTPGVHIRACDTMGFPFDDVLSRLLPVADGTEYVFSSEKMESDTSVDERELDTGGIESAVSSTQAEENRNSEQQEPGGRDVSVILMRFLLILIIVIIIAIMFANSKKEAREEKRKENLVPARRPEPSMYGIVEGLFGIYMGKSFIMHPGMTCRVGKDAGCEVQIENNVVSRMHCVIQMLPDGTFQVTDYSLNGTYYDNMRLEKGKPYRIPADAILVIGDADNIIQLKQKFEMNMNLSGNGSI